MNEAHNMIWGGIDRTRTCTVCVLILALEQVFGDSCGNGEEYGEEDTGKEGATIVGIYIDFGS